jgi:hypothetical protein
VIGTQLRGATHQVLHSKSITLEPVEKNAEDDRTAEAIEAPTKLPITLAGLKATHVYRFLVTS